MCSLACVSLNLSHVIWQMFFMLLFPTIPMCPSHVFFEIYPFVLCQFLLINVSFSVFLNLCDVARWRDLGPLHLRQGSKYEKPKDQFEANWTLNWSLFHIKKTFFHILKVQYSVSKGLGSNTKNVRVTCERIRLTFSLFFFLWFLNFLFFKEKLLLHTMNSVGTIYWCLLFLFLAFSNCTMVF